ncbi:helix-turn-helix domain-containing protein [Streptomyces sp. NPDC051636]|uniref:helix-turn-helix domain-containing protein n=1 Tax=Streptomyces sp. NPDC051636 TaxID=3365663 RepID=UPI0037A1364C
MHVYADLGEFLRARRARLRPEDIGLATYGERRRVPGLRREEIALLAGVSASYYSRLEQGHSLNASPEVLDAIARALQLDDHETAHMADLARAPKRRTAAPQETPERVTPAMRQLLRTMDDVPAVVTGRRGDVLAWNGLGHALFAGHLDFNAPERPRERPNTAELVFLDPHIRALYTDWDSKAQAVVEHLRLVAGRHPDDPRLASLIGHLVLQSPEFAELWTDHRVHACDTAVLDLHHPLIGSLTITQQTLTPSHSPEQALVVATTEPGTASEAALTLLAHATTGSHQR